MPRHFSKYDITILSTSKFIYATLYSTGPPKNPPLCRVAFWTAGINTACNSSRAFLNNAWRPVIAVMIPKSTPQAVESRDGRLVDLDDLGVSTF